MRIMRVFMLMLAVMVIGGCGIYHVDQPSDANKGETITIDVEVMGDGDEGGVYAPAVCINLPTDWTLDTMTFTGIVNDTVSLSGTAGVDHPDSETYMEANHPEIGYTWNCYLAPEHEYSAVAYGAASFQVTLASDADGPYGLRYTYGDTLDGNPDDWGPVSRTLLVNSKAGVLDNWTSGVTLSDESFGVTGTEAAYGNGRYIVTGNLIGMTMYVWNSTDGISWEMHVPVDGDGGGFLGASGLVYAEGLFVSPGGAGQVLTSADGISWTSRDSKVTTALQAVAHGGGNFVVVGTDGSITSSADGMAWTAQASGTTISIRGVAYGDAGFVAVLDTGEILSSADGVTWASQTLGTGKSLNDVTFGNGIYLAVGEAGEILNSVDGETWAAEAGTGGPVDNITSITFGDGIFAIVNGSSIYTSANGGATWIARETGTTSGMVAVSYANGRFVATGDHNLLLTARAANSAPTAPVLVSPADLATGVDGTLATFKWKASTDADGDSISYDLYACTDSGFAGCDPLNATEITASAKASATYAAAGGTLGVFFLMGFALADGLSRRRKVALVIAGLIVAAMMVVGCGSSDSSPAPGVATINYDVSGLTAGTDYFWKVVATDQYGDSTDSETRGFTAAP